MLREGEKSVGLLLETTQVETIQVETTQVETILVDISWMVH